MGCVHVLGLDAVTCTIMLQSETCTITLQYICDHQVRCELQGPW